MKELSLLLNLLQWSSHKYVSFLSFDLCLHYNSGYSVWGLTVCTFCVSLLLHYMKFFDGMDDDGSELNLLSFVPLFDGFWYSVLYLNSPLLRFMIMNGGCCFRSSKRWGIHQEP
jgi:hypothetical protein